MTKLEKISRPRPQRAPRRRVDVRVGASVAAAVALAGAALFNGRRASRAERDNPPAGKFIEVEGVRLHYVERGEGPPLVLLHGNGAFVQDFQLSGLTDAAAAKFRVIAFDRPGFGFSDRPRTTVWTPDAQAELIFKAMSRLGIERPIVLGHSWGTLAAVAMALNHPDDIAGLVLLAGYYFPTARPDVLLLSPPAIPILGDLIRYTISPLLGRLSAPLMFKAMFAPAEVPKRFAAWPIDLALRPSQIRASAADTAMMVPSAAAMQDRYRELQLPVAIIGGRHDKIAHFDKQSERLHAILPTSDLVIVEGAGHMVHYTGVDQIMTAVARVAAAATSSSGAAAEVVPSNAAATF